MTKNINKFLLIFLFIIISSCGYKILDNAETNNFNIKEINSFGDKRINFKIKNNLLNFSKKKSQNILLIDLNTKKIKNIKEKNIKNEITKYEISLNVDVEFNLINSDENYTLNISNTGSYLVVDSYSTTLNNEKKLIDDLIENISEKILKKISLKLNDI